MIVKFVAKIYLNLFKNPEYKQIFEGDLEPDEIYKRISLLVKNVKFIEGDTLIFIDEIQACNKARTALKFLATDDKYDIVASGSLLGLHYNKRTKKSPARHHQGSVPKQTPRIPGGGRHACRGECLR